MAVVAGAVVFVVVGEVAVVVLLVVIGEVTVAVFVPRPVAAAAVVLFLPSGFLLLSGLWWRCEAGMTRREAEDTECRAAGADPHAASEDRAHDLRIMRPTRCQLRYRRHYYALLEACLWPFARMVAPNHDTRPAQAEPPVFAGRCCSRPPKSHLPSGWIAAKCPGAEAAVVVVVGSVVVVVGELDRW